jgi:hypothetical protein
MGVGSSSKNLARPAEVRGVEGRGGSPELAAGAVEAIRVARGEDHVGPLLARAPGGLEPDARAPADHDHRLAEQLRGAGRVLTEG